MKKIFWWLACLISCSSHIQAQTDLDGIMMSKNLFCVGAMYGTSSWDDYWEGTRKRDNLNLGTVSMQMAGIMGAYGVTNKLNLLFGVPYVKTKASAGTLHGVEGIQDLSLWAKYIPYETKIGKGDLSVYGIVGVSFPLTNYVADYLPLAIGMKSKTLQLRGMADYQWDKFFVGASGTYAFRGNIEIDRDAYYTTEMHYTNKVEMPNVFSFNIRAGYRYTNWLIEGIVDKMNTIGGFDITRNNMPFPGNNMDATKLGLNVKYEFSKGIPGLSLIGNGSYVVAGRNVGQSKTVNAGIFYIINFKKNEKTPLSNNNVGSAGLF